jgi:hypothetical protein
MSLSGGPERMARFATPAMGGPRVTIGTIHRFIAALGPAVMMPLMAGAEPADTVAPNTTGYLPVGSYGQSVGMQQPTGPYLAGYGGAANYNGALWIQGGNGWWINTETGAMQTSIPVPGGAYNPGATGDAGGGGFP